MSHKTGAATVDITKRGVLRTRGWLAKVMRRSFKALRGTSAPGDAGILPRRVRSVPVGQLICLENFYDVETGAGQHWRWTGPGPSFSMFFQADRKTPVRVSLEVQHSPSPVNWHNTFLECDGVMTLCAYHTSGGRHYLEGVLPARSGASGATVRYHVQETRRPPEGNDGRLLGLRVLAVHIG